jgi:hypothetical protein
MEEIGNHPPILLQVPVTIASPLAAPTVELGTVGKSFTNTKDPQCDLVMLQWAPDVTV